MGYSSEWRIRATNIDLEELCELVQEYSGYSFYVEEDYLCATCTWYEYINDLKKLSEFEESTENVLISVERYGEDVGDIEQIYVKNGKGVKKPAVILFPEFNEDDLQ